MKWPLVWRSTFERALERENRRHADEQREARDRHERALKDIEEHANQLVGQAISIARVPHEIGGVFQLRISVEERFMRGLMNGPIHEPHWQYIGRLFGQAVERKLAAMDFTEVRESMAGRTRTFRPTCEMGDSQ